MAIDPGGRAEVRNATLYVTTGLATIDGKPHGPGTWCEQYSRVSVDVEAGDVVCVILVVGTGAVVR